MKTHYYTDHKNNNVEKKLHFINSLHYVSRLIACCCFCDCAHSGNCFKKKVISKQIKKYGRLFVIISCIILEIQQIKAAPRLSDEINNRYNMRVYKENMDMWSQLEYHDIWNNSNLANEEFKDPLLNEENEGVLVTNSLHTINIDGKIAKSNANWLNNTLPKANIRQSRVIHLFPMPVDGECLADDGRRTGSCLNPYECRAKGGSAKGDCAMGFGVCCIFIVNCNETISNNITYLVSPNFPSFMPNNYTTCTYKVKMMSDDISQLRIDFNHFSLGQPNRRSGVCDGDVFNITGGPAGNLILCGQNSGQHLYYDITGRALPRQQTQLQQQQPLYGSLRPLTYEQLYGNASRSNVNRENSIEITMRFSNRFLPIRLWEIRIAQIPFSQRAPAGCLQYHTGTEGIIQTFNFAENGRHLANQHYRICMRQESDMCSIVYQPCDDQSFRIGTNRRMGSTLNPANTLVGQPIVNADNGGGTGGGSGVGGPVDAAIDTDSVADMPTMIDMIPTNIENDESNGADNMPVAADDPVVNTMSSSMPTTQSISTRNTMSSPSTTTAVITTTAATSTSAEATSAATTSSTAAPIRTTTEAPTTTTTTTAPTRVTTAAPTRATTTTATSTTTAASLADDVEGSGGDIDAVTPSITGASRRPRPVSGGFDLFGFLRNAFDFTIRRRRGQSPAYQSSRNARQFYSTCTDRITMPCIIEDFIGTGLGPLPGCEPVHCGSQFCSNGIWPCRIESTVTPFYIGVHFGNGLGKGSAEDNIGVCLRYSQIQCI